MEDLEVMEDIGDIKGLEEGEYIRVIKNRYN